MIILCKFMLKKKMFIGRTDGQTDVQLKTIVRNLTKYKVILYVNILAFSLIFSAISLCHCSHLFFFLSFFIFDWNLFPVKLNFGPNQQIIGT